MITQQTSHISILVEQNYYRFAGLGGMECTARRAKPEQLTSIRGAYETRLLLRLLYTHLKQ